MRTSIQVLLSVLWLGFLGVTGWALWEVGYFGVFDAVLAGGPGTLQVFVDLVVACVFATVWLVQDARARGLNPWPWVIAVFPLGSIPILTYALVRDHLAPAR